MVGMDSHTDSNEFGSNNLRLSFDDIKSDYEHIRSRMYKEMEIEKIQNKIYLKLKGKPKSTNFIFDRCDDRSMFYEIKENQSKKEETIEQEQEENSDIIDLNDLSSDHEEEKEESMPKSKFLDLEAEEGSSIEEVDYVDDFDYKKDVINQEKLLERFERKYLRKKGKKKRKTIKIEEYFSSSSENFEFQNADSDENRIEFEKDEKDPECAKMEERRHFD